MTKITTIARDMASQENCDGEEYDMLQTLADSHDKMTDTVQALFELLEQYSTRTMHPKLWEMHDRYLAGEFKK